MSEHTQAIWDWFNGAPLRVLVIFLVATIGHFVGHRAIDRAIARLASADLKPGPGTAKRQAERARTIGTVFSSTFNAAIWIIAFGMILGEFGFNLGPVIASAGVIGVALGRISRAIFAGERGAPRDAVLLNAAAAIAAFEGDVDSDIKTRLTRGLARAVQAVDSGAANELLNKWAALTQEISAS